MTAPKRDLEHDEQRVYGVLSSDRFLRMEGLSKEVPFFIYHFPPSQTRDVKRMRDRITAKLRNLKRKCVTEVNLYDLAVELLTDRGVWERVIQAEPTMETAEFREMLQGMLDPHDHLAPAIRSRLESEPSDMVFLTGIGEVFPFIRAHTVLENLQSVVVGRPLLAWFPGTYEFTPASGHQLRALNLDASDSYYRAKDIIGQEA